MSLSSAILSSMDTFFINFGLTYFISLIRLKDLKRNTRKKFMIKKSMNQNIQSNKYYQTIFTNRRILTKIYNKMKQ